ncbi:MAG: YhcH/YjgK/YiaL family protein [Saprospiraceae bacterium]|jgi:biofilm protein TabA|nr:YhcH/YjgK/YiaL family protein [Saprospiraceae bacterium]
MIIDTIGNASKYEGVHPLFNEAFNYIRTTDFNEMPDGKFEIADGLIGILSKAPGKIKEASLSKFECHDKNIDIQLCIKGQETFGWKPRSTCKLRNGEYNEEKDVQFFADSPDMFFELSDDQFVIFFPEDVHAPMIGNGDIKKLVIKVRI